MVDNIDDTNICFTNRYNLACINTKTDTLSFQGAVETLEESLKNMSKSRL